MTRPLIARLGLILVVVLVAALPVYSQTNVSGHLKDAAGVAIPGSATTFVQFDLMFCGLNDAKVSGVAILPGNSYRSTPSALGVINIPALYGNDVIACGPTTGGTRWNVTKYVRNVAGAPCRLNISGTSFNLDTATCENAVPPPATPTTNYENISHSWTAPQSFGIGTTFPTLDTAGPNTWTYLHTFGAGITGTGNIGTLHLGTGALGTSNTFTAPQNVLFSGIYTNANNWQSTIIDGLTLANVATLQAGATLASPLTITQLTPVGATVFQASGLQVITQINSATPNQVAIYSQALAGVNAAKVWNLNPSTADYDYNGTQHTSVTLHTIEPDVNVKDSSTAGDAIFIQGNLAGNTLGNVGAISIPKPSAGGWGWGINIGDQALWNVNAQAMLIGSTGLTTAQSYPIIFRGRDGAGTAHLNFLRADSNGALTMSGALTTNGAYSGASGGGDFVVYNGAAIKSDTNTHNASYQLISGNVSNKVSIDSGAQGVVTGGAVAIGAGLTVAGGASIANSNAVPQVGTPTVGQAACIKAAGPPVVIGYCSTVVSAGGACTCN